SASPQRRKRASGKRSRAMSAPRTTMSGALSPPMASSAIVNGPPTRLGLPIGPRRSGAGVLDHLAAPVMPAGRAHMVRHCPLAAVRAFDMHRRLEPMMRTAHVAARLADLLLGHGHDGKSSPDPAKRASVYTN